MPTVTTLSSTQKPITRTGASARKSTNSAPSAGPRTRTPPAIKWLLNERAALAGAQQSTQDAIPRLQHQVDLAQERLARAAASQTEKAIKVVMCFSEAEMERVTNVLRDLKIQDREDIVLIDAGRENKTSGSKT